MEEQAKTVLKEETVLEKFEGDVLVERITMVDGTITNRESFGKEDNARN